MRIIISLLVVALSLTACGHRGDLKRPAQIEREELKKQEKMQKDEQAVPSEPTEQPQ